MGDCRCRALIKQRFVECNLHMNIVAPCQLQLQSPILLRYSLVNNDISISISFDSLFYSDRCMLHCVMCDLHL